MLSVVWFFIIKNINSGGVKAIETSPFPRPLTLRNIAFWDLFQVLPFLLNLGEVPLCFNYFQYFVTCVSA